jgi:AcrR family transcriptional regulator
MMTPARRSPESTARLRASLMAHARQIVVRDGADGLTMRRLAEEAGCAVGLPYKVFSDRSELVGELLRLEFEGLRARLAAWERSAGSSTVAENLGRYARLVLDSPAVTVAAALGRAGSAAVDAAARRTGVVNELEGAVIRYLAAEQERGRVDGEADAAAFGFLVAGAIHNLLVSGELYPRPDEAALERALEAVAGRLAPPAARARTELYVTTRRGAAESEGPE